ncbi:transaldolase [Clostridium tertium]|jgi:transaldolase|uniref:transaldolase n=1 Tax=Clostridium TaxID=1485 RepID=UPI00232FB71F|nr:MULTISPECIES: transaldolase [Clostridium]MDB1944525.1 transaldolase [Clostridium tertium]MDB1951792.1 transaldolase [Clostridium tertium]MDU1567748.1 transaldolase [Clostridium sp.]MDU4737408.1 transaldolase [Clostridium sp.]
MIQDLKVKIYADGADLNSMLNEYGKGIVSGFTTNPSLMKSAGVKSYRDFGKEVLNSIKDMPISFEVFGDDKETILKEAREIYTWGENVYVKVPVVNTKGEFNGEVIKELADSNIKLNITAIFTTEQVKEVLECLNKETPAIISIFAGRIADAGVNPIDIVKESISMAKEYQNVEILWASCRELYNIIEADKVGCHIITVQNNILNKINLFGKDLTEYSIETVKAFFKDANSLGFSILE